MRYDPEIIRYVLFVMFFVIGWPSRVLFAEAEEQVAQGRATLDRLSRPLEALLRAFEPEGVVAAGLRG